MMKTLAWQGHLASRTIVDDTIMEKTKQKKKAQTLTDYKPPFSLDGEMGVLSSILLSPAKVMPKIEERITSDCFFMPAHKTIFEMCLYLHEEETPIDLVTLTQEFADRDLLDSIGGPSILAKIHSFLPTSENVDYYIDIVREKYLLREMLKFMNESAQKCLQEQGDVAQLFIDLHKEVLSNFSGAIEYVQAKSDKETDLSLLHGYVDTMDIAMKGGGNTNILSTPFQTINEKAGGTGSGEVTGITGIPSSGKSIVGKQFITHALLEHKLPCLVLTGEMPYQQWMNRLIAEMGHIHFNSLRSGKFNKHEIGLLRTTIDTISKLPLYIYDRKRIRFRRDIIEGVIRREAKQRGVKFVLLDYLQLVETDSKKQLRTDQEIGEVSNMLKGLAVEYGLHVIVLCAESDDGKIRNSREPEYDFDNIIKLLVRTDKNPKNGNPMIITDGMVIAKWRDAERGYRMKVEMEGQYSRFKDISGPNLNA